VLAFRGENARRSKSLVYLHPSKGSVMGLSSGEARCRHQSRTRINRARHAGAPM